MKKLFVVLSALVFAGSIQASELWWTVGDSVPSVDADWNNAYLFANDTGYNYGGDLVSSVTKDELTEFGDAFFALGDGDWSAKSFYIELYSGSDTTGFKTYVDGRQGAVAYADLASSIVGNDVMNINKVSPYSGFNQFTTTNVVPEPTSGLLMLIGLAGLALKRKRA